MAACVLLGAAPGLGHAPAGGHTVDSARFAAGSCVSFPPTSGRRRVTVYIDAGHGGPDPGAVGTSGAGRRVEEASVALGVALEALPLLRRDGFRVVLSRTGPAAVARALSADVAGGVFTAAGDHRDLVARDACADRASANLLLGVYFDASNVRSVRGSLTLFDAARPFWRASLRLAGLVQQDVLAAMNADGWRIPDDGVHADGGFGSAVTNADRSYGHLVLLGPAKAGYLATPTTMPGALIEPLYLTNLAEATIAASRQGQRAVARGLAAAVEQYFGVGPTAGAGTTGAF